MMLSGIELILYPADIRWRLSQWKYHIPIYILAMWCIEIDILIMIMIVIWFYNLRKTSEARPRRKKLEKLVKIAKILKLNFLSYLSDAC